jgi:hypothetical protein
MTCVVSGAWLQRDFNFVRRIVDIVGGGVGVGVG